MFDLKNKFDYYLRSAAKFSRKNYSEDLNLTKEVNGYAFDILSQTLRLEHQKDLKVLDIGSKNWEYARGEYKFFRQYCENLVLDGVEIDAYRLYSNFYSRYEYAKFYIKDLAGVNYYPDDLLNIKGRYDYIIWILPFVTKYPLKRWGLPEKFFMPEKLLEHAYSLLKKDMLIINQGEEEAEVQEQLFKKLKIPYKTLGEIKSKELEYRNRRFGFLVSRAVTAV